MSRSPLGFRPLTGSGFFAFLCGRLLLGSFMLAGAGCCQPTQKTRCDLPEITGHGFLVLQVPINRADASSVSHLAQTHHVSSFWIPKSRIKYKFLVHLSNLELGRLLCCVAIASGLAFVSGLQCYQSCRREDVGCEVSTWGSVTTCQGSTMCYFWFWADQSGGYRRDCAEDKDAQQILFSSLWAKRGGSDYICLTDIPYSTTYIPDGLRLRLNPSFNPSDSLYNTKVCICQKDKCNTINITDLPNIKQLKNGYLADATPTAPNGDGNWHPGGGTGGGGGGGGESGGGTGSGSGTGTADAKTGSGTTNGTTTDSSKSSSGGNTNAIIGAVGGLLLLLLIAAIIFFVKRRRQRADNPEEDAESQAESAGSEEEEPAPT